MTDFATFVAMILASSQVKAAFDGLTKDLTKSGKDTLIRRLTPSVRRRAARASIELFAIEWTKEMKACAFESAHDGYRSQLRKFIDITAADIADMMSPEARHIDFRQIESVWDALGLDPLPEEFDWNLVAQNFSRAAILYIMEDPELRAKYGFAQKERLAEAAERTAKAIEIFVGPEPEFDLQGYRKFLIENKCNALQLGALHTSTYERNTKLLLWSIFVEPSARESIPFVDIAPEYLRQLRQEGHLPYLPEEEYEDVDDRQARYASCPVHPIREILGRERLVVVTGDPGSGKTSLVKYRALQWAKGQKEIPLPLLIDLRQYALKHEGLVVYCESGLEVYGLARRELSSFLKNGTAAFYLDGLDEVFDIQIRNSIIEEIATLSSKYEKAKFVVTSRKIGYDPKRLTDAGFLHATIEDFDQSQMTQFIDLWYSLAETDSVERDLLRGRMKRAIKESQSIRELAGNPLLLTMMVILNRNQELPRNRGALYQEASRVLLDEWDTRKALPISEFDRYSKESLLRELGADLQKVGNGRAGNLIEHSWLLDRIQAFLGSLHLSDTRVKASALVKQLTERNFILSYAGADRFCFVHRTFLEYYCASFYVKRFQAKQDLSFDDLRDRVFGEHWRDERWHQVLQLIAGMIEPSHAGLLIEFLISRNGIAHEWTNLILAAGCLNEVRRRKDIQSYDEMLWEKLTTVGIGASNAYENDLDPYRVREAAVRVIAITWREDRAFPWLLEQANISRDATVRLTSLQELVRGWPEDPKTLPIVQERCLHDHDSDIRRALVRELALGWPDDPRSLEIIIWLELNDKNPFVRDFAQAWHSRCWPNHPAN